MIRKVLWSRTFERSNYPIDSFLQVVDFWTDFRSNRINPHRKYDHPCGARFGSPDYERLQVLDSYAAGQMSDEEAMRKLSVDNLQALQLQMLAAGLKRQL